MLEMTIGIFQELWKYTIASILHFRHAAKVDVSLLLIYTVSNNLTSTKTTIVLEGADEMRFKEKEKPLWWYMTVFVVSIISLAAFVTTGATLFVVGVGVKHNQPVASLLVWFGLSFLLMITFTSHLMHIFWLSKSKLRSQLSDYDDKFKQASAYVAEVHNRPDIVDAWSRSNIEYTATLKLDRWLSWWRLRNCRDWSKAKLDSFLLHCSNAGVDLTADLIIDLNWR